MGLSFQLPILFDFQGFPAEFAMYLNYCRGLRFEEAPDYMYLRQLFRILFRTLNHQYDYVFDWTLLKQKAAQQASSSSTAAATPGTGAKRHDRDPKTRGKLQVHFSLNDCVTNTSFIFQVFSPCLSLHETYEMDFAFHHQSSGSTTLSNREL